MFIRFLNGVFGVGILIGSSVGTLGVGTFGISGFGITESRLTGINSLMLGTR
jgi:hypothetical protein